MSTNERNGTGQAWRPHLEPSRDGPWKPRKPEAGCRNWRESPPRQLLPASPLEAFRPKAPHPPSSGLSAPQCETALTVGKAVAGLNAQSKGRRLGIFEEAKDSHEEREPKIRQPGEPFLVSLLHPAGADHQDRPRRASHGQRSTDRSGWRQALLGTEVRSRAGRCTGRNGSAGEGIPTRPTGSSSLCAVRAVSP